MKKQLKGLRYQQYDVDMNDVTNDELLTIMSTIQDKSKDDLEALLAEATACGKGDLLRAAWKQDVLDRKAFKRDQTQNGKLKNMQKKCE